MLKVINQYMPSKSFIENMLSRFSEKTSKI